MPQAETRFPPGVVQLARKNLVSLADRDQFASPPRITGPFPRILDQQARLLFSILEITLDDLLRVNAGGRVHMEIHKIDNLPVPFHGEKERAADPPVRASALQWIEWDIC